MVSYSKNKLYRWAEKEVFMSRIIENPYENFIALSRYARWISEENRREKWGETVDRYFDFMLNHLFENYKYKPSAELIEELKDSLSLIEDKSESVDKLLSELEKYKNNSKKGNDQIDDSLAALQIIKKNLDESTDKLDTVIGNLMDYNDEGRKYLYTENK